MYKALVGIDADGIGTVSLFSDEDSFRNCRTPLRSYLITATPAVGQTQFDALTAVMEATDETNILPTRHVTKLAFRNRFTQAEKVAIEIAQLDNPAAAMQQRAMAAALRASQQDIACATYIDLDRADTRSGVQQLEAVGLLTVGRATQILDAEISNEERYKG